MKRLLLIVLPLLLIVGCSSPEPINYEETLNERDGVFYTKDTNKPYSGQVFSLFEDGKKKEEGSLKDGKMISKTEWEYNRNGQKELERTYKDGKQDSLMTYWDNDGKVYKGKFINMDWDDIDFSSSNGTVFCYENGGLCLCNYKDGIMDGIFIIWNENGQKMYEETYKNGELDGLTTKWDGNGEKRSEFNYKNGKLNGLNTTWDGNGNKSSEGTYKDGKEDGLFTDWYSNGQKESEGTLKDGEKDGLYTEWYYYGQKKSEKTYKDGKKDGLFTQWYENGQKQYEGTLKDGEKDGLFTQWYENGQKQYEGTLKDGEEVDMATSWHENGQKSNEGTWISLQVFMSDKYGQEDWNEYGQEEEIPPKLEFIRLIKSKSNIIGLIVTTYGNKNGIKTVIPLNKPGYGHGSGIYGKLKEEQPEKRVGNIQMVKYSFDLDEPEFGSTTEIKIKVVDKYKAESVSDNEFEYYD